MLWLWHLTYFLLVGLVRAWQGLGWLLKRCRWVYNWLDFVKHWVAHVPNRAFMTWLKHNDSAEVIVVGGDLAGQEILATIIYNLLPCISVHSLSRLYDITWYYSVQVLCIMSLPLSSLYLSLSLVSMWFDSSCPFAKDGRTWWYYVSALLDISRPTYWVEMGWAFMVLILFLLLLLHPSSAISHPVFFVSHCRLPWHLAPSNFQLLCVRSWTTRRRIQGTRHLGSLWQP